MLNGTGRASSQVETVVRAAHDAQVDMLFVASDRELWGRYDAEKRQCDVHAQRAAGDQDLLDLAAIRTALTGGKVHTVPREKMPADSPLAATFRFPEAR